MAPLVPILIGLGATVLALARIVGWVAVGATGVRDPRPAAALPASIVLGAALTACVYAVSALAGRLTLGLAIDGALAAAALLVNGRRVQGLCHGVVGDAVDFIGPGVCTRLLTVVWLVVAWLTATAPPRDADVMRYHLAHIRQIVLEGRWTRIVDTSYALPFGWSLTWLPFEILHVAVAAQMINLLIWVVVVLAVFRARRTAGPALARGLLIVLSWQPMVFKAATTAHADVYAMLVMAVVALLIEDGSLTTSAAALLGCVAWVGAQSRYQAIGIGVAASLTLLGRALARRVEWRAIGAAAAGAVGAGLLAAPFYLANLVWFGDPVWPFLVGTPARSAADRVARILAERTTEPLDLHWLPLGLYRLAIDISVFPIPWLVAAAVVAAWSLPATRRLAALVTCYLAVWALVEPVPFPRFVVFLVPVVPLLAAEPVARWMAGRPRAHRAVTVGLSVGAAASAALVLALNIQAIRYAVAGARARYDRATWFAPVFQWANTSSPPAARFLVVVKAGGTYPLERVYRRADPEGSAEIDWSALPDARALADVMRAGRFEYLIYEDRDWHRYPGGDNMTQIVRDAIAAGRLAPVATFPLSLVTSRLFGRTVPTIVRVLRATD